MKKTLLAIFTVIALAIMSACSGSSAEQVPVQSVSEIVGMGPVGVAQRFAGVVSTQDPVKIMKNGETKLGEFYVEEGDEVKEDDALFTYDTDQLTLDLEKAKLELEKLQNDIVNMQKEKEKLEEEKAEAPEEQQLQYTLEINSKDTEILEADFNSAVKQKEIESLERSLENAVVKAPSSGRIGTITDGTKTDNMGNTLPILTIVQTNDLLIRGSVNENNIYSLTPGMEVLIRSRIDGRTWTGTLSKIDMDNPQSTQENYGMMDSGDGTAVSSKYPFYVEPDNSEGMMLGQHVYVEPFTGDDTDGTWRLPAWYICDIDSAPYVWAEDKDGKLEKRSVTLGAPEGEDMNMDSYIITEGLTLEDKIAFPDEKTHEGMECVDYRNYVPEEPVTAEETNGGGN
ncbi:MAG: efflux RND transporter periplasmic adaptor subunit [Lachnospiraceae bacterium]|nr:efflux RND transporter periplasmic adaptor subunit [Lachnospiraceae bacterium]